MFILYPTFKASCNQDIHSSNLHLVAQGLKGKRLIKQTSQWLPKAYADHYDVQVICFCWSRALKLGTLISRKKCWCMWGGGEKLWDFKVITPRSLLFSVSYCNAQRFSVRQISLVIVHWKWIMAASLWNCLGLR